MFLFYLLAAFIFSALGVIWLIALLNTLTFPRLRSPQPNAARSLMYPAADVPLVSILIPAHNEATPIGATVRSLRSQSYTPFEVIILDDHSSDGTGEIARLAAENDPRIQVIAGQPLLEGWLRKNWACQQLSLAARGRVLVFADATLQWHPDGIAALVEMMQRSRADLLTIWATQITRSRSERLVVPLMALAILGYLPVLVVHQPALPEFAAASGQCLAFRREAYQAVGGYIAVRDRMDIAFARRIKAKGMRLRMADGAGLITCRMYRNWREVRDGFARYLLVGYGGRVSFLVLATLFHLLVFVLPWVWLLFGTPEGYPLVPLVLIALGVGVRGLTAWITRQRVHDAFWMPISVLLMTRIAVHAIWWQRQNGRKVQA